MNRVTFGLHLFDIRENNIRNSNCCEKLKIISNSINLKEDHIKEELQNKVPKIDELKK